MILLHCVTHLRLRRIRAIWQVQLHFELCQASVKTNLAKIHLEYLPKKLQSPSQLLDFFQEFKHDIRRTPHRHRRLRMLWNTCSIIYT